VIIHERRALRGAPDLECKRPNRAIDTSIGRSRLDQSESELFRSWSKSEVGERAVAIKPHDVSRHLAVAHLEQVRLLPLHGTEIDSTRLAAPAGVAKEDQNAFLIELEILVHHSAVPLPGIKEMA
jgi:hypothetical protein